MTTGPSRKAAERGKNGPRAARDAQAQFVLPLHAGRHVYAPIFGGHDEMLTRRRVDVVHDVRKAGGLIMAAKKATVHFYKARNGEWRWRLKSRNGEIISRTNARGLYCTFPQQLAHATVNGAAVKLTTSEQMQLIDSNSNVIGTPSAPNAAGSGFDACTWATSCS